MAQQQQHQLQAQQQMVQQMLTQQRQQFPSQQLLMLSQRHQGALPLPGVTPSSSQLLLPQNPIVPNLFRLSQQPLQPLSQQQQKIQAQTPHPTVGTWGNYRPSQEGQRRDENRNPGADGTATGQEQQTPSPTRSADAGIGNPVAAAAETSVGTWGNYRKAAENQQEPSSTVGTAQSTPTPGSGTPPATVGTWGNYRGTLPIYYPGTAQKQLEQAAIVASSRTPPVAATSEATIASPGLDATTSGQRHQPLNPKAANKDKEGDEFTRESSGTSSTSITVIKKEEDACDDVTKCKYCHCEIATSSSVDLIQLRPCGCLVCKDCFIHLLAEKISSLSSAASTADFAMTCRCCDCIIDSHHGRRKLPCSIARVGTADASSRARSQQTPTSPACTPESSKDDRFVLQHFYSYGSNVEISNVGTNGNAKRRLNPEDSEEETQKDEGSGNKRVRTTVSDAGTDETSSSVNASENPVKTETVTDAAEGTSNSSDQPLLSRVQGVLNGLKNYVSPSEGKGSP